MSARLIHVGEDHWHRLQVLRTAGMSVDQCRDVNELTVTLCTGTDPYGVLLAASPIFDPAPAVKIIRPVTECPVILFASGLIVPEPQQYDLVVDPLTYPRKWIDDICEIIRRSRQIRAESRALRETSERLMLRSAETARQSRDRTLRTRQMLRADRDDPLKPTASRS